MSRPTTPNQTCKQIDKFRELARDLDCDDDEVAFRERVKRIVKAPRATEKPPAPKG